MMASLRARLLATLLALTAVGLLLLGGITYAEQRSFLYDRADDQARAAVPQLAHRLTEDDHDYDRGFPRGPGGARDVDPQAGTYGELRAADGTVLNTTTLRFSVDGTTATAEARPQVPADPPVGRIITVPGVKRSGTAFRLLTARDPFTGGTIITAVPLREATQTLHRLLLVEGLVITAILLLLAAVAWIVVRIGLLPLDRMGHTAGAIAGGDLSHRVRDIDPRTEVGRLGIALNAMLDRLEGAFAERQASEDKLRQFLADASHELRTPLASIRGYAELFRMGAIGDDAEQRKALQRIEDEAARMGILVEDLLTLARLDEVADAPHGPVDVGTLVRDAVDDARATAPDRPIEGRVQGDVTAVGDPDQLRQVLGNLVRNALTHTPEGTAVEVSATRDDGHVRLEVRDHGKGLPTNDPDALFERFWRSEGGRTRGKAGAGLGLAIVAAIVDAHRGEVRAADAPEGGASFVVRLPAAR